MPTKKSGAFPSLDPLPVHVHMTIPAGSSEYTIYGVDEVRPFRISIRRTHDDIKNLNILLQHAIQNVANTFGQGVRYEEALRDLARKGNYAFDRIFTSDADKQAIRAALGQETGRVIQIVSENFFIPWELLYDGPLGAETTIDGYWGTKYVISRVILDDERSGAHVSPYLETLLPKVGLIASDRLQYVLEQEIPALQRLHGKKIALQSLRDLSTAKRDEELLELGNFLGREWHFLHFACHAYEREPIEESYLSVTKDFSISMIDFTIGGFDLSYHPFVILNACQTGVINPLYTSSWARKLWARGARGVLATDFKVPDDFAADFSVVLYHDLLRGVPIGKALLHARQQFWEAESNPLGLAYALYSSPSIKVIKPRKQ